MTAFEQATRIKVNEEINRIPPEYLENALKILRIFRESIELPSTEVSLRQAWQEAMTADTHPIEELWAGIDVE